jgi:hypothetical protein
MIDMVELVSNEKRRELRALLQRRSVAGDKDGGDISPERLGLWLRKNTNRIAGGVKLYRSDNKATPWIFTREGVRGVRGG